MLMSLLRGSAGVEKPSRGYTFVPGVIFFASYNDCTAASRNILLQLASRNRSDGCVTRYPGSAHVYARENFVTPFFATASCAARTPLACMNDCIAWSRAASVGTGVPVTVHARLAGMSCFAKIAA